MKKGDITDERVISECPVEQIPVETQQPLHIRPLESHMSFRTNHRTQDAEENLDEGPCYCNQKTHQTSYQFVASQE